MDKITDVTSNVDCGDQGNCCTPPKKVDLVGFPSVGKGTSNDEDIPCCGPKQGPPSSPFARPGYVICNYVEGFHNSSLGPVPKLKNNIEFADWLGTFRARCGISRDQYKVSPGLYCVGKPDSDAPVLVTANYKLTIDSMRRSLAGVDAWILALDTRGVNVWCAAGKKNFSTEEVVRMVKLVQLDHLVRHRVLILPQLGAPGVAAHQVKKRCGFQVKWGPVRAGDIKRYLQNGESVDPEMREVTFTAAERLVLIPVELSLIMKPSILLIIAFLGLSGISSDIFSVSQAWNRGIAGIAAYIAGCVAGAVLVPAFLQWLPARSFYVKGAYVGGVLGALNAWYWRDSFSSAEMLAMLLISVAVSSFAAMNFTGATPYTSPSGVEWEMRRAIPLQAVAILISLVCWVWTGVM